MNEQQKQNPDPEEIRSIFDDPGEPEQTLPAILPDPEDLAPETALPKAEPELLPEEVLPVTLPPEDGIPEEVAPEEVLPEDAIPEEITPEEAIPEEVIPAVILPEEAAPEEVLPEEITPEEVIPAVILPEEVTPEEALPSREELPQHLTELEDPDIGEDILADETAVVGLPRHGEEDLDRLLQEAKSFSEPAPTIQEYQQDADRNLPREDEEDMKAPESTNAPKRRPKRKQGYGLLGIPHILVTLVWLGIVVLIGMTLGTMLWVSVSEILAFGKPEGTVTVTISDGDNIDTVTAKLEAAGVVRYPQLFKFYADLTDAQEEISPGTFTLNTNYDYFALVNAMSYHSPARETITLVIPEGHTCAQIFTLLEENGVCTVAELEDYAANGEIRERWFLEGLVRGDKYCLEGYLFPDTYEFYTNDEPGRVIGKFLDGFDSRFTDLMRSRIDTLNERMAAVYASRGYDEAFIEAHRFSVRDIIIIASMIERETANDAESYDISSVIYNRLTNPANFPYLNIDATLIYALGGNIDPETGKTKPLTSQDLQMEHPYNTYTCTGLIPGPISNPGRNSLNAALEPTETVYYFYVYNPNTSTHLFAKTSQEHEKNVNYVRSLED